MKKILIVLLCISIMLFGFGCASDGIVPYESQHSSSDVVRDNENLQHTGEKKPIVEIDTTGMYHISEKNAWILIPEEYALFTRDMDVDSEALKNLSLTREDVISYLDAYGSELLAISPDGMEVMIKFKKTGFKDFSYLSNEDIAEYAEGLRIAFDAEPYELVESNDITWVKLKYSHSVLGEPQPAHYVRYATIAGGWDIFLWGSSYNGQLLQHDLEDLQSMFNSFLLMDD